MAARSPARSSAGPGRDVQVHAHLGGDDAGERGLAEPGRARRAAGGRRPGRARRAASRMIARCSLSSAWPTNSSSRRGPQPGLVGAPRRRRPAPGRGTRHARRAPSSRQARRAADRRRVAVRRAARAAPRGSRRARSRGRPAPRATSPTGAPPCRPPADDGSSIGSVEPVASARPAGARRSSCRRRARASARRGRRRRRCRRSAAGAWVPRMASASAGPTPWAPISDLEAARSSRRRKPYSVWASSRMWWWT